MEGLGFWEVSAIPPPSGLQLALQPRKAALALRFQALKTNNSALFPEPPNHTTQPALSDTEHIRLSLCSSSRNTPSGGCNRAPKTTLQPPALLPCSAPALPLAVSRCTPSGPSRDPQGSPAPPAVPPAHPQHPGSEAAVRSGQAAWLQDRSSTSTAHPARPCRELRAASGGHVLGPYGSGAMCGNRRPRCWRRGPGCPRLSGRQRTRPACARFSYSPTPVSSARSLPSLCWGSALPCLGAGPCTGWTRGRGERHRVHFPASTALPTCCASAPLLWLHF